MSKIIPMAKWGKDHWSMLGYIETLCVDSTRGGVGEIDFRLVRRKGGPDWKSSYGTRLWGFFQSRDPKLLLRNHDDMDCLYDIESAGFVEVLSVANGFVKMTAAGSAMASLLREHKASGGMFATFRPGIKDCA